MNYVVLRRSPDWAHFDIEQTRVFLAAFPAIDNDLIVKFAERWDAVMAMRYIDYRQAMKDLALSTARAVRRATFVTLDDLPHLDLHDDDRLYFTDDDDWVSPDLFERLEQLPSNGDGWLWNSVFVGKLFGDTPEEGPESRVVRERPASDTVYTNNYAVTGAAFRRLGAGALVEHTNAQLALDGGRFVPVRSGEYLSAANKHLCCTVCIHYNQASEAFQSDMAGAVRLILDELAVTELSPRISWLAGALQAFQEINRRALPKGDPIG
ncbi:hypothetical protein HZ989_11690 [Brevundimonas sp. AJA228-03]|uniref:hypothetical protein n=1 Tax=Brevundimonas sp. AJA228-03 TaxID=2752515 RepID=UPI001ADF4355|nr:hypothetical protein [Brevundimonas sp. AJA228-03]QTN18891.1 hypothetical protein HZ989_11690 [Brevundimonas sp. AJA228-03]